LPLSNISFMPTARTHIQSYALFGESCALPDVLHCETIAARSRLHDWELKPHRHPRLHQLLVLISGGGTAQMETSPQPLPAHSLVNVPAGCVHGFRFEAETQGFVLTMADEAMRTLAGEASNGPKGLSQPWVGTTTPAINSLMRRLWLEYQGRGEGRVWILRGLSTAILGLAQRQKPRLTAPPPAGGTAAEPTPGLTESNLLARFQAALEQHHQARWSVADYARHLAISPTHLSRICRQATGRPASRLMAEHAVSEARRLLAYTQLRVTTIAYELGYTDPAHFTRQFTRLCGVSPKAFRQLSAGT
jgi:AraC family transcriptional activator of pobA